jgi:hypothetical protein
MPHLDILQTPHLEAQTDRIRRRRPLADPAARCAVADGSI